VVQKGVRANHGVPESVTSSIISQRKLRPMVGYLNAEESLAKPFVDPEGHRLVFEIPYTQNAIDFDKSSDCMEAPPPFPEEATTGAVNLHACLRKFSTREQLDEENKFCCPKCKAEVQAFKRLSIWRTPELLNVHIKRFTARFGQITGKLDTKVEFPSPASISQSSWKDRWCLESLRPCMTCTPCR
jgi:hypothetical protein